MNSKLIRNIVVALAILAIGIFVKGKLSAMSTKEEIREDRIKPRVKVIEVANDTINSIWEVERYRACRLIGRS